MDKEYIAEIRNKLQAPRTLIDLLAEGKEVPKKFIEQAKKSMDEAVEMLKEKNDE